MERIVNSLRSRTRYIVRQVDGKVYLLAEGDAANDEEVVSCAMAVRNRDTFLAEAIRTADFLARSH